MDVKRDTIKGIVWSMIERFSTMGIQLLCTLAIAQYLAPSEFGLVSMMSIFLSFSRVMAEAGFGQAIIREKNVLPIDTSSIFIFNILVALVIYGLCFISAPLIATFYRQPELTQLVRVSFLSIIVHSFAIVQGALLQKSVNFSVVSKVSLISVILSGIIGIAVAIIYKNVWALVIQSLGFATFQTCFYWLFCKWRPTLIFSWKAVKKYLAFSLNLLGSRMIAAIADNMANLFIGRAYTSTELGNYTVPDKLQRSVAGTISFSIHRVSYSVMSTFQDDISQLRIYSQKIVGMAFYIISPIMLFLLIVSEDFFNIILSSEWSVAAHYFKYLYVIGMIYCFPDINMDVLLVRGKSKLVLWIEIVRKSVLVLALVIGVCHDMEYLLLCLICFNVFNTALVSWFSGREIKLGLLQQFFNVIPTIICLIGLGLSTEGVMLLGINNIYYRFLLCSLIACLSYVTLSRILNIQYLTVILSYLNNVRKKL